MPETAAPIETAAPVAPAETAAPAAAHVPTPSSFLILHGWENHRPASHWERWLAQELTARGHDVRYPQLPDADHPVRSAWREAMLANLATLTEGTVTVITHSLSGLLWLHEQSSGSRPVVDRVALVAPPEYGFVGGHPVIGEFAWRPDDGGHPDQVSRLSLGAPDAIVVHGEGDEYAPNGLAGIEPYVDARGVLIAGAGHIVPATGFGPWPEMLAWCEGLPAFGL